MLSCEWRISISQNFNWKKYSYRICYKFLKIAKTQNYNTPWQWIQTTLECSWQTWLLQSLQVIQVFLSFGGPHLPFYFCWRISNEVEDHHIFLLGWEMLAKMKDCLTCSCLVLTQGTAYRNWIRHCLFFIFDAFQAFIALISIML